MRSALATPRPARSAASFALFHKATATASSSVTPSDRFDARRQRAVRALLERTHRMAGPLLDTVGDDGREVRRARRASGEAQCECHENW